MIKEKLFLLKPVILIILFASIISNLAITAEAATKMTTAVTNKENTDILEYVKGLRSVNLSDNPQLAKIRDQYVNYYSKVHIVKTIHQNGYTVDCVAFEEQPALFGKSADEIAAAKNASDSHGTKGTALRGADFDVSQCPQGTVPIMRPQLQNFVQKKLNAFVKNSLKGYSWVEGGKPVDYSNTQNVWVALNVNTFPTLKPNNSSNDGHILNQLWWLTDKQTCSLETGWITSNYFTSEIKTTIFVFSTTDSYSPAGTTDNYNLHGGFVQYAGSQIALGTPITTDISYVFQYTKMTAGNSSDLGYELDVYPLNPDGTVGTMIPVGFYPYSRFPNGQPANFNNFSAGAEVYNLEQGATAILTGNLYGFGTNFNNSLNNSFPLTLIKPRSTTVYEGSIINIAKGLEVIEFSGSN